MKRSTLLTFAAFAIVAACSDATLRSPTEPRPAPAVGASLAVSGTEGAIIATDNDSWRANVARKRLKQAYKVPKG